MAEDNTDLLMMFKLKGRAIEAECQTTIDAADLRADKLLEGFEAGRFFEVTGFSFKIGIADDAPQMTEQTGTGGTSGKKKEPKERNAGFARFRSADPRALRAGGLGYPVDVKPITFKRSMDQTSLVLFRNCCDRVRFDSATLVKRRPSGSRYTGEVYLRLDFTDVLIVGLDWEEAHAMEESCSFVYRKVEFRYRPQRPDGSLGAPVPGSWSGSN